jgi:anti-sigma B factor antagonist
VTALEIERRNDVPVAHAREDIDAANARSVGIELAETIGGGSALVLDLSETRYVDSAGIDMIFRLAERLRQRRAQLALVIPASSPLTRLAEIVGLPRSMPVCDTLEQALAACSDAERESHASE